MFKPNKKSIVFKTLAILTAITASAVAVGQEEELLEEIVVVGSQIKGAAINTALPVSIITADDIDALALDSGEELLENMAEMGINYFTEAEAFAGGVNSVRGDIGSYNLRNMGVGNTLVLLNGRRLVNAAGYQTELLGGDYVPTLSVNSNVIPTSGMRRVEVLKDGASAIYGADAVAGVINNVIDTNYEGLSFNTKLTSFQHFNANDVTFSSKFGKSFNDGDSHVTVLVDYYNRDSIKATEDERWGVGDHRKILPYDSLWKTKTAFRNLYSYQYAQLDQSGKNSFTDSKGEMQILPSGDAKCAGSKALETGHGTCLVPDTTSDNYYLNPALYRDFRSAVKRSNIFATFNHTLNNDLELFSEVGFYSSSSLRQIEPAGTSSSAPINIGADYYYTNQLVQGATNPLAGVGAIRLDGMRNPKYGRTVHADKRTTRFLVGLRGTFSNDWDWESAILNSKATTDDLTNNRISNNLLTAALADSTSAAFNIFSINGDNIERALIDVYRNDTSELTSFDFKMSNNEAFSLPAGPVAMLLGYEYRKERYEDDRDPRLDGTIKYAAANGSEFPFVSDVLGSSPTTDSVGSKSTTSIFSELQIPVSERIDAQFAIRKESISDAGSATVGKFAVGFHPTDWLLLRGSWQSAFRAPNLVQINQAQVARFGSRFDAVYQYITENKAISGMDKDSKYTIQRFATGAKGLQAEESINSSIGFVIQPSRFEGLTITYDKWEIEKDKTIGLFGRDNHTVLDLVQMIANGNTNCASSTGNTAVLRDTDELEDNVIALFSAAGICPVGQAYRVTDEYINMAKRTLKGHDIGVRYDFDTKMVGEFGLRYNATFTDTFDQVPTGNFASIQAAQASGILPAYINLKGFGNLLGIDGNYDEKHSVKLLWKKDSWGGSITALKKGSFTQSSLTLSDGTKYVIPAMTTMDVSLYYRFEMGEKSARIRFGVKNVMDERAPTADRFFGFFADAHQDYGRNMNLSLRVDM